MICKECYTDQKRITPLVKPLECLQNHTQYICGTCGRCICIEKTCRSGLQRWNFPFQTLEMAKLYIRVADYTMKKCCGIYEIINDKGRKSYKIFASQDDLLHYLKKNTDKTCQIQKPLFSMSQYREYPNTQVRRLTYDEAQNYLKERCI